MRRIVMFTNTYSPRVGGLERSVATLHDDLNRSGNFCRVVTPAYAHHQHSEDGILRVPALQGIGEKRFSIPLPFARRIERWIEAIGPHLLHAHQPFLLGGTAQRLAQKANIPLVFSHHTFYERYAHYIPAPLETAQRLLAQLSTTFANRCQLVIAPTSSVRDVLLGRGVQAPIAVAPTGVDVLLYGSGQRERARHQWGLTDKDLVVGHLGRLSREKNLEFLVNAVIALMKQRAEVRFLLVGNGDRLAWAKTRLREAGLADRAVVPGIQEGTAAADAYAAMDLFAFASHSDTQGLVLAEAMSAGVPIVALDAPGARDCIDAESGLLLAASSDEHAFAQACMALLEDTPRRQAWSFNARSQARRFSREHCLQTLTAAYEETLERYPRERAERRTSSAEELLAMEQTV